MQKVKIITCLLRDVTSGLMHCVSRMHCQLSSAGFERVCVTEWFLPVATVLRATQVGVALHGYLCRIHTDGYLACKF